MVVVAVHLYNAMKGQLKWNGTMWSGSDYVVLWTVLANAMKWNSAYMDIMKQCYIFVKREYNDGIPWSRIPEGAQNSTQNSLILGSTTPASTHHRSSWTGQMNFSYSLISNSFNSIIIVLYLFCALPTVADIWKIVILLKFEIIIASYAMHNVYCDKFKFFEIIAFGEFSIHWCQQFRI